MTSLLSIQTNDTILPPEQCKNTAERDRRRLAFTTFVMRDCENGRITA